MIRKDTLKGMGKQIYVNRELSWLKFNERVLEEAEKESLPLAERLTFASIYQSNLDEFFMVRVGSLTDQAALDETIRENKTNMTAREQIDEIIATVRKLNKRKDKVYASLVSKLDKYKVSIVNFQKISRSDREYYERYFDAEVAPIISPMIVGKRQPFPFLRNKEIYAAVALETKSGKQKIGIIPCEKNVLPRLIELPNRPGTFILAEELILHFVNKIFKGYAVKAKSLIRITRNADIDTDALYDEDLDYREFMAEVIKKRKKLAPVRIELSREIDGDIIDLLCEFLELDRNNVFRNDSPLDLSFVFQIQDILRKKPELFYEKRSPRMSPAFESGRSIIEQIKEEDKLLSYPYESIKPFLSMLHEAAEDKDVVSIKMTLYRVARQSKVVEALIEAAENGKEVIVLVELKARFDEENNIEWSRLLEDAGCQVIYGLNGYKVHSKICLITRKNENGVEYISQIGTGNYNEKTSKLYTDLSLMTADSSIGYEISQIFTALSMGKVVEQSDKLLVAPKCLQNKVIDMIDNEIQNEKDGKGSYIGLKLNSLTDKKIIDKLICASQAGVHIEMVVRGICCLVPGVQGYTENIRIVSIVGRYLEHSRIYIFGAGENSRVYIGSADFMTRNTVRRVEVAAPVLNKSLKEKIIFMFNMMLKDNKQARELMGYGQYENVQVNGVEIDSQDTFGVMELEAEKDRKEDVNA